MPELVLALDQGTTSSRAVLIDGKGRPLGMVQEEHPQIYPHPGWVEHDPEIIWGTQLGTARRVIAQAGVSPTDIAAIGITNQRETVLLWERSTGRPIANAIVWQDRRTVPLCEKLRAEGREPWIRDKTGLVLDPYFSATKLVWLLSNVQGARERAERGELAFGTVDTFLLWRLTAGAVHATDVSNASRTMLFNIHTLDWDEELLQLLHIPRAVLPKVLPSSTIYGEAVPDLLGAPIPIGGVAGDQQAATFGQACFSAGMVKNTYGTGSFLLMNTGGGAKFSAHGLLSTVAWQVDGSVHYALEGSVFVTGAAVQWLRDELGVVRTAAETEALAQSVPDSGGVYFVPAFVGLGAPYWDSGARGTIVGLTRGTTRAHLVRAVLEATCYQARDVIDAMQNDAQAPLTELRVDGGMVANNALLQMQADILGIPVLRPAVTETTALGAAYLAGLAVDVWRDMPHVATHWRAERVFEPKMRPERREELYSGWKRAVERARAWVE